MEPITVAMGLAQFVPQILKWLTGSDKAAEAAGKVVEIAQVVTGTTNGTDALSAIKADPSLVLQFRTKILESEAELDKAYLADIQNARQRDIVYVQSGVTNSRANWMIAIDAVGLLLGLSGMLALGVLKANHNVEINDAVFGALLGQLATITSYFGLCLRDAHQFEFGSSRSSRNKDEVITNLTGKQPSTTP